MFYIQTSSGKIFADRLGNPFPTVEDANNAMMKIDSSGRVITMQEYLELTQQQQQEPQFQQEQFQQTEEDVLARNRRYNEHCRNKHLMHTPRKTIPMFKPNPIRNTKLNPKPLRPVMFKAPIVGRRRRTQYEEEYY